MHFKKKHIITSYDYLFKFLSSAYSVVFVILIVHFYICTIEIKIFKINQRMTLQ